MKGKSESLFKFTVALAIITLILGSLIVYSYFFKDGFIKPENVVDLGFATIFFAAVSLISAAVYLYLKGEEKTVKAIHNQDVLEKPAKAHSDPITMPNYTIEQKREDKPVSMGVWASILALLFSVLLALGAWNYTEMVGFGGISVPINSLRPLAGVFIIGAFISLAGLLYSITVYSKKEKTVVVPYSASINSAAGISQIRCGTCGTMNNVDSVYCKKCANRVNVSEIQCGICGTMNDIDALYCKNCANRFR